MEKRDEIDWQFEKHLIDPSQWEFVLPDEALVVIRACQRDGVDIRVGHHPDIRHFVLDEDGALIWSDGLADFLMRNDEFRAKMTKLIRDGEKQRRREGR
jgi:hypothetical protein